MVVSASQSILGGPDVTRNLEGPEHAASPVTLRDARLPLDAAEAISRSRDMIFVDRQRPHQRSGLENCVPGPAMSGRA